MPDRPVVATESAEAGWLAANVAHFARALRRAGIAVGPDRVLASLEAIGLVGVGRRDDVHAALSVGDARPARAAAGVRCRLRRVLARPAPVRADDGRAAAQGAGPRPGADAQRPSRVAEALAPPRRPDAKPGDEPRPEDGLDFEAAFTASDRERLQKADFESMTAEEFDLAKRLAEELPMPVTPVRRRRHEPSARGTIDLRSTLQAMARQPATLLPRHTRPREEMPSLVVLLDISGSMDRYARLMLHWVHGLTRRHLRVSTFTFGTRLTNISRALRNRDPDVALAIADAQVADWKGGTRIATCLGEFNRRWARRVLGGNAAAIFISDGLDTDIGGELSRAAQQLRLFAREIVWLNPLLRFEQFQPRAAGIRALLPNVDRMLPMHNLASLADLGRELQRAARHHR